MSFPGEGSANDSMQKIRTIGVQTTAGALKKQTPFFGFVPTLILRVFNVFTETLFRVAIILIFHESINYIELLAKILDLYSQ